MLQTGFAANVNVLPVIEQIRTSGATVSALDHQGAECARHCNGSGRRLDPGASDRSAASGVLDQVIALSSQPGKGCDPDQCGHWTLMIFGGGNSLLQGNVILTGLHVVNHNREVRLVFKPADPSGKANADEVVTGDVVKVAIQRDLALIHPRSLPKRRPLEISQQDIEATFMLSGIHLDKGGRIQRGSSVQLDRIMNGHTAKATFIVGQSSKRRLPSIRVIRAGPFCLMTGRLLTSICSLPKAPKA
jgi:hypothetical protein